jgi:hypothetical protein
MRKLNACPDGWGTPRTKHYRAAKGQREHVMNKPGSSEASDSEPVLLGPAPKRLSPGKDADATRNCGHDG